MNMKRDRTMQNLRFQITWSTNCIRFIATDKDITNRKNGRILLMSFHLDKIRECEKKLKSIEPIYFLDSDGKIS